MAKILLQEMIAIAAQRKVHAMTAFVRAENKAMLSVFEKAGFQRLRSEEPDEVNLQLLLQPFWSLSATVPLAADLTDEQL
jgi:RimJ/RimL family protein N-acetyltransferase